MQSTPGPFQHPPQSEADREGLALLRSTLAAVAPGTALRDGLELVLRGRTGALVVLGNSETVERISTGGFTIDTPFTPARVRELAKMDGAIVLDRNASWIHSAGVQLLPDPTITTRESGTRHRTAERVAKQTGFPVVSVSQSMSIVQLYVHELRHVLESTDKILSHASQALDTLERYRMRLDEVTATLTELELGGRATLADVLAVVQRHEMVRRISEEIDTYELELGPSGRLVSLQHAELLGSLGTAQVDLLRDYLEAFAGAREVEDVLDDLAALTSEELIDADVVTHTLGAEPEELDRHVWPRGFRLLGTFRRLPGRTIETVVADFDGLHELAEADIARLTRIPTISRSQARIIREGLDRIASQD